jgi:hypothetical protein
MVEGPANENSPEVVNGEDDKDQPIRIHLLEGPANENSPEVVDGEDDKNDEETPGSEDCQSPAIGFIVSCQQNNSAFATLSSLYTLGPTLSLYGTATKRSITQRLCHKT